MQTTIDLTTTHEAQSPATRPITILLPVAPPQTYLRWLRWWRTTDRRARTRIDRADLVTRLALAPHPGALLWDVLAQEISRQAGLAKRQGRVSVMPRIRTTNLVVAGALGYMDRRQRFLELGLAERSPARIAPPSAEFIELRKRLLRDASRQLTASTRSRSRARQAPALRRPRDRSLALGAAHRRPRARSRVRANATRNPGQAA